MAGEKLVEIIRQGARGAIPQSTLADILYGQVTSTSPIKILIDNRFEVGSSLLILSPFCYDNIKNSIVIWEGLRVGDKVNLLRASNGQKFYILDKGRV